MIKNPEATAKKVEKILKESEVVFYKGANNNLYTFKIVYLYQKDIKKDIDINELNELRYKIYMSRKYLRKIPESTLFNEAAQERLKLEKEKKNDQWKRELQEQIKEKQRRDERKRKELEEQEKKDLIENDKVI